MIKELLLKVLFPVITVWLLVILFLPICQTNGEADLFLLWVLVGFPFGVGKMILWLIPKNYGIAGAVGVFAMGCLVSGMIGGVVVVWKLMIAIMTLVRSLGSLLGYFSAKCREL